MFHHFGSVSWISSWLTGLNFPIWTHHKIRPGNRASPVTELIWRGPKIGYVTWSRDEPIGAWVCGLLFMDARVPHACSSENTNGIHLTRFISQKCPHIGSKLTLQQNSGNDVGSSHNMLFSCAVKLFMAELSWVFWALEQLRNQLQFPDGIRDICHITPHHASTSRVALAACLLSYRI